MKVAIMQPYLFPYIGYFQLLAAVERWVVFDDVNFIKKGWINRNQILVGGRPFIFSLPLDNVSQYQKICEVRLVADMHARRKLLKTIAHNYRAAPFFDPVYGLVEKVFEQNVEFVGQLACSSVVAVLKYLEMPTEIISSSRDYENSELKGERRVLDICRRENATEYLNLPGGKGLYCRQSFEDARVALRFIQPKLEAYSQFDCSFVPGLSIIDVMMFNDRNSIRDMLSRYEVV